MKECLKLIFRSRYLIVLMLIFNFAGYSPFALAGANPPPHLFSSNISNMSSPWLLKNATRRETAQRLKPPSVNAAPPSAAGLTATRSKLMPLLGVKNGITAAQRENLLKLIKAAPRGRVPQVIFDMRSRTPAFVKLKSFVKKTKKRDAKALDKAETIAREFLATNQELLNIENADRDLTLLKSWADNTGASHFKYQQTVDGIPVFGKELTVHLDGSDEVYLLNGRFEPTPTDLQTVPKISAEKALETVKNHLNVSSLEEEASELVVFTRPGGDMVLTYKMDISVSLAESWTYFIDALSGVYVHRLTRVIHTTVSASGTDLSGATRNFTAWQSGGAYYLVDPTMPSATIPSDPIVYIQSSGDTYILTAENSQGETLNYITGSAAHSGWDAAGVSAIANIKSVYEYYKSAFGRDGIDDNNKHYLAAVHLGVNYANAFWNGTFIVFGDGDGSIFTNLAESLDVTAHEIQHGITQYSANLVYENQSGALNEAYSDLFACMVDNDDWTVGEDITLPAPGYLRNLAEPDKGLSSLPTTMSEYVSLPNTEEGDWGGVHINMSIPSRAGYLMAEGLDDEGLGTAIGRTKTARIWYRALTTYLTAYSQFADARTATLQSAEDLYGEGSAEVTAVQAAWDAVEVTGDESGDGDDSSAGGSGDSFSEEDIMIYLFPTDGSHDTPNGTEYYDLYALLAAGSGYLEANDLGPLNSLDNPSYTKPTAYTNQNGDTTIFYVTTDYNLHSVLLSSAESDFSESTEVDASGNFYSIAVSPNGRYFAYTTPNGGDNHIYVMDFEENRSSAISLTPSLDGDTDNTIFYADSMAFDFTGRNLVFDALNCISTPESLCSEGAGYRYWSIGFLQLADDPDDDGAVAGTLSFPFSDQNPDLDLSYPVFAANNSYVIAADIIDYSNSPAVDAMVWSINTLTGSQHQLAAPNIGSANRSIYGTPSFWSQDDAVTIQRLSDTNGSAYRVPIDSDWAGPADDDFQASGSITALNDRAVALPVMHQPEYRSVSGEITFSASSLNFSHVDVGDSDTVILTLKNNSDREIRILDISLTGAQTFTHTGANGLLARDELKIITVQFTPATTDPQSATLQITSNADNPSKSISITGNTSGTTDTTESSGGDGESTGGGGSGCMIDSLIR